MADVDFDPECNDFDEIYGKGLRAYALQDYDLAVSAFGKAAEILAKKHAEDLHDSLGDVYLYYGKSLLQLTRKYNNPLGENVLKDGDEGDDDDEEIEEVEENTDDDKPKVNTEKAETKAEQKQNEKNDEQEKRVEEKQDEKNNAEEKQDEKEGAGENLDEGKEDLSDLQIAWEVLELAKTIFTKRGEEGKKSLADTLIVLGEISLESNMFAEGIDDMKKGLEIQKTLYGNDSRIVAETYYKIGMSLGPNEQEAIDCFTNCIKYLQNRLKTIGNDESNKDEVEEIKNLIPEVEEKINDVKNFKEEMVKEIASVVNGREAATPIKQSPTNGASSSAKVNDISHLVKRKRKDDEVADENPAKKPSP